MRIICNSSCMARYLDPKNDLTFKRIFGEHPERVINFLNAVLPFAPRQEIETVEYLPPEQIPESPDRKNSIVDVRSKGNSGRQFIVEMQMHWTEPFRKRIVFNGRAKGEAIGLEKGEAIGLEKGLAEGEAKRIELQENVVINRHRAGFPVEIISTITGLTPKQIADILKQHGLI